MLETVPLTVRGAARRRRVFGSQKTLQIGLPRLPKRPPISFQNHINSLSGTDYYAYLRFRNYIQSIIDIKIRLILEDTWNKVPVSKDRYIEYVNKFQ